MPARVRILLRNAIVAVGLVGLAAAGALAWLLRDPVPYIQQRRSTLERVFTELIVEEQGHANERVVLHGASGLRVDMILRRPAVEPGNEDGGRRPVFLILGGYRTGDRAATLIPNTHGNIVVALSYPYDGDVHVKGLKVIPALPRIRRAIMDTPAAIMLAIDYLLSREDVDSTRVELVGASFGAPFGCVVGALDPRVTRVWAVHGAAWPYDQIELNLRRTISFGPARKSVALLANVLASGPRLDPAEWAPRIAPRQFIMINATDDERMPRAAIDALYEAAREPKDLIWTQGAHVQRNRPEVLASLVATVLWRAGGVEEDAIQPSAARSAPPPPP